MRARKIFRFSDSWTLEDRIALSQAGVAAEIATAARLDATFHGKFTTRPPVGLGGPETATLNGTARVHHGRGVLHLRGFLKSNGSLAPPYSNMSGELVLTGANPLHGALVLEVTGPPTNLAPPESTTTNLSYTVLSAWENFARLHIRPGTADLTLHTRLVPPGTPNGGVTHGTFTLVITELP